MSKIKKIRVSVTYSVGLGDIKASKEVIEQFNKAYNDGDVLNGDKIQYTAALDWIESNIKERDCFEWECEVEQLIIESTEIN